MRKIAEITTEELFKVLQGLFYFGRDGKMEWHDPANMQDEEYVFERIAELDKLSLEEIGIKDIITFEYAENLKEVRKIPTATFEKAWEMWDKETLKQLLSFGFSREEAENLMEGHKIEAE